MQDSAGLGEVTGGLPIHGSWKWRCLYQLQAIGHRVAERLSVLRLNLAGVRRRVWRMAVKKDTVNLAPLPCTLPQSTMDWQEGSVASPIGTRCSSRYGLPR